METYTILSVYDNKIVRACPQTFKKLDEAKEYIKKVGLNNSIAVHSIFVQEIIDLDLKWTD